jgi:hypothetical protein
VGEVRAPNRFPISRHYTGTEFSCPDCGYLRVEADLLEALDNLTDTFGKPSILIGSLCYGEARKLYQQKHPSAMRGHARIVPYFNGRGVLTSWETTTELRLAAEAHGVVAHQVEDGTVIMLPEVATKKSMLTT